MRPPQHRIDATPVLIRGDDPAWDWDRATPEIESMEPGETHPLLEYIAGDTRCDIGAVSTWRGETVRARDYLLANVEATKYTLRRLTIEELCEVQDMFSRERGRSDSERAYSRIWYTCARYGLAGIDGPGAPEYRAQGGRCSEQTLREVYDTKGLMAIAEIGAAVWRVSQPLSDAEKKL